MIMMIYKQYNMVQAVVTFFSERFFGDISFSLVQTVNGLTHRIPITVAIGGYGSHNNERTLVI